MRCRWLSGRVSLKLRAGVAQRPIFAHRETLVNTFVNAIYLYDDKVLLTFNYKEGTKIISLDDVASLVASGESGSDLDCLAPPVKGTCLRKMQAVLRNL